MNPDGSPIRLFVSAGEASGDRLGAALVRGLRAKGISCELSGIGGPALRSLGLFPLEQAERLSGMGFWELLPLIPRHLRLLWRLKRLFQQEPFDLAILIDYPGFHLHIAPLIRAHCRLVWYGSPQVWAWRSGRLKRIRRWVDHMLVLLPFELPVYERLGVPVSLVAHPALLDCQEGQGAEPPEGISPPDRSPSGTCRIALLPGSRRGEIRRHLGVLLEAAEMLWTRHPECEFELLASSAIPEALYVSALVGCRVPVHLTRERVASLLPRCQGAWVASGTATLEVALAGVPLVIFYRLPSLTYVLARALVRVRWIGLPNLILGEQVVPELIQSFSAADLVETLTPYLFEPASRAEMKEGLARVRAVLERGAGKRAEDIVAQMLTQQGTGPGAGFRR